MTSNYIHYQGCGLACLPVKENKSPASSTWPIEDIKQFEGVHGIGVACGSRSGGLEVLDFDNHFGDATQVLTAFRGEAKEIFEKHNFVICSTKSGGYHVCYRCEEIEGNQKLASRPKHEAGRVRPDAIIETRGEGGYIVAPPTPGYKAIRGSFTKIPVISVAERSRLFEIARSFNEWAEPERKEWEQGERPGDIYNRAPEAIDNMKTALIRAGWKEVLPKKWRRPGKDDGISATLGVVAENVFYCFTSNGHPFEGGKAYLPFQVVCLLERGGDFSEFAKDLASNQDVPRTKTVRTKDAPKIDLSKIIEESMIDLSVPVPPPPLALQIKKDYVTGFSFDRLFTLGNFSAITGKSKSKKTFFCTMLLAAACGFEVENKLKGCLPGDKSGVLMFDTEQSRYDAYTTAKRVERMIGKADHFGAFDFRRYSHMERCEAIEAILERAQGQIGYMVIDGIADLSAGINDEDEATRVTSLLMRWTAVYECHISVVIHQNKMNNFATGHLGSAIMKKAEAIISVEKDENDKRSSVVTCDLIRGTKDFEPFSIAINEETKLPEIV